MHTYSDSEIEKTNTSDVILNEVCKLLDGPDGSLFATLARYDVQEPSVMARIWHSNLSEAVQAKTNKWRDENGQDS